MLTRRIVLAAAVPLLSVGVASAQDKLKTVATFSILADLVKNVGGDRIEVQALVGPNADAHVYQPSPGDAKALLVLEDGHWADAGTLLLLRHLARTVWGGRVLLVMTFRDTEVDMSRELTETLADLRRFDDVVRMRLEAPKRSGTPVTAR